MTRFGARAHHEFAAIGIVSDRDRVVPDRKPVQAQVLENEHRAARIEFGEHRFDMAVQPERHTPMPPCGRDHLGLQAAFAFRNVDLGHQGFGRHRHARAHEHGRQRRRPALVALLREERRVAQLDADGLLSQTQGFRSCDTAGEQRQSHAGSGKINENGPH